MNKKLVNFIIFGIIVIVMVGAYHVEIKEMVEQYIAEKGWMMFISQVAITVLGVPAIYLSQHLEHRTRRWGSVLGLSGQSFWVMMAYAASAWGVLLMTLFYTHAWWTGFRNHWLKGELLVKAQTELTHSREQKLDQVLRLLTELEDHQLDTVERGLTETRNLRAQI